ncbi:MAG: preprotein translocase subunit SecG [Pseudomonadota bacterium]
MAVHVVTAIAIVVLVLLQQGKGADAGAAFGSGASQTMFGSAGTGNFLTRATTIAAVVFFATSLTLAIFARQATMGGVDSMNLIEDESLLSEQPADSDIPQVESSSGDASGDVPRVDAAPEASDDVPSAPDSNE